MATQGRDEPGRAGPSVGHPCSGENARRFLEPRLAKPTPQLLSVYGSLHLVCALAAARDDDRASADTHIDEAEASAARLGADGNYIWTAFGPTNVKIHQVCVAMEFGDVQRAIEIAPSLDTSALPVERRVRHASETFGRTPAGTGSMTR